MYVQQLKRISRHALCTGLAVLSLLAAGHARADKVSLEELRSILIRAAELSSRMAPTTIPSIRALETAPPEVLEVLRDAMSDPGALALSVDRLEAAMDDAQGDTAGPSALRALALLSTDQINRGDPDPLDPPKPAYPESPGDVGPYNTFTATLNGLGALVDSDGDGRLNDERCGADYEADLQIGYSAIGIMAPKMTRSPMLKRSSDSMVGSPRVTMTTTPANDSTRPAIWRKVTVSRTPIHDKRITQAGMVALMSSALIAVVWRRPV